MCAGHQTSYIEKFDGHGAPAGGAGAVVGFTFGLQREAGAGAGDLEVADCALRVDCGEGEVSWWVGELRVDEVRWGNGVLPTLEEASVKLSEV